MMNDEQKVRKAVALEYSGVSTPRVTATGENEVAEEILRVASEHDVPIYRDDSLAQVLSELELQSEIPPMLYVAVAEVLAFTYQLQDLLWVEES